VYHRLHAQAARLHLTPEQVVERLLNGQLPHVITRDDATDLPIPPAGSAEALAAVHRLTSLFADINIPQLDAALADPLIASVRNSAGAVISGTTADNIVLRDAQLTFTPGANGTYYIVAASAGNTMGTFKLSVALANPAPQGFAPQSFQKADGTDVAADGFATLTGVNPAYAEPLM